MHPCLSRLTPGCARPLAVLLGSLVSVSMAGAEPAEAFHDLGALRANQAYETLSVPPAAPGDVRATRLGLGLALLNRQPRSEANLMEALRHFETLAAENPADEAGVAARYFAARWWQIHAPQPDLARARRAYLELAASAPEHPLAQYGLVKVGILDLYTATGPAPAERIQSVEALLPRLTHPAVRRNLRHVLGQACQVLVDDPERALGHYEAALADGLAKDNLHADVLLRAAETARRTGDARKARIFLEVYVERYPRSHAARLAREILASLP